MDLSSACQNLPAPKNIHKLPYLSIAAEGAVLIGCPGGLFAVVAVVGNPESNNVDNVQSAGAALGSEAALGFVAILYIFPSQFEDEHLEGSNESIGLSQ